LISTSYTIIVIRGSLAPFLIGWRDDRAEIWIHKAFTEGVE
jgi:hypothetical protein